VDKEIIVGYIMPIPSFNLVINQQIIVDDIKPTPGFRLIVD